MSVRSHKTPPGRARGAARWTPLEVVLIVISIGLIAFPMYIEAYRWVNPGIVPAASRPQEQPAPTEAPAEPTAEQPAPTEGREIPTPAGPGQIITEPTEAPAEPTAEPTAAPAEPTIDPAEPAPAQARATLTPIPPSPTPETPTAVTPTTVTPTTVTPVTPTTVTPVTPTTVTPTTPTTVTPVTPTTVTPTTVTPSPTPILGEPELALIKNTSRTSALPGEELSFSISVFTNNANTETIEVEDTIDQQLQITSATASSGSCNIGSGVVSCTVTAIRNGPATINITVRVRPDATPGARLSNRALAQDSRQFTASSDYVYVTVENGPGLPTVGPGTAQPTVGPGTAQPTAVQPTTGPGTAQPTAVQPTTGPSTAQPTAVQPTSPPDNGGGGGGGGGGDDDDTPTAEIPPVLPPTPAEAAPPPAEPAPTARPRPQATARPAGTAAPTQAAATAGAATAGTASLPTLTPISSSGDSIFFTLASDWGSAFPGQNVNYVIAARNNKSADALREVVIAISLPSNLEIVGKPTSDRGDPEVNGNRVVLRLSDLASGQGVEINIPTRIRANVAVDTRIVSQAELIFAGLSTSIYSNIAPVLVVGQAQQPTVAVTVQASPTIAATATTSAPTVQSVPTTDAGGGAYPAPSPEAQAPSPTVRPTTTPTRPPTLPETNSGIPISGIALLGLTMLTRTVRLHRAQSRI